MIVYDGGSSNFVTTQVVPEFALRNSSKAADIPARCPTVEGMLAIYVQFFMASDSKSSSRTYRQRHAESQLLGHYERVRPCRCDSIIRLGNIALRPTESGLVLRFETGSEGTSRRLHRCHLCYRSKAEGRRSRDNIVEEDFGVGHSGALASSSAWRTSL